MKLYIGITALWAVLFHRTGTAVVAQTLNLLDAPFDISAFHEAQINCLLSDARRKTPAAAAIAHSLWRQNLQEEVFAPAANPLRHWNEAYRMVIKWQAGKLDLPPAQAMVHAALAALNGYDTFLSILPESRQRAKEAGLTVLPKLLV